MLKKNKQIKFNGKKIKLPWNNWSLVEISPEGIHTSKGVFSPNEIELLLWKAAFYDRGKRIKYKY
jgi:hypothetical protein